MALHSLYGATVVVVAFGMVTVEPAYAQRRDGNLLPQDQSGQVTAVGCLVRGNAVRGGKADKYVLARPKKGPVESVPEATCTAEAGADALTLDNPEKAKLTDSMLGRWVEITGRLESETSKDPDNLRELDVAVVQDWCRSSCHQRRRHRPPRVKRPRRQRQNRPTGPGAGGDGCTCSATRRAS